MRSVTSLVVASLDGHAPEARESRTRASDRTVVLR